MKNNLINNSNKIFRVDDLEKMKLSNLKRDGDYIVLEDISKEGILESNIYEVNKFYEMVGAWCALTNDTNGSSFIELEISVRVNGEFSKYFTYGKWRLYGDNLYYNQDDKDVYMDCDEILTKDDLKADAFKFRVKMTKYTKLFLIVITYESQKYDKTVDEELFKKDIEKKYDVPKLNQNMVPVIGGEMCSATTTAMLLKYKGVDFSKFDCEFEHRYVASLVADRGHNSPTYGNWTYNTVVMGAYGFNGYIFRVENFKEFIYLLDNVGPVGISIRGDTGVYKTGGHLMVAIGYKIKDGKAYVLCNDPNINERFGEGLFVYYEFELDYFSNFFRGMCYVIE